MCLIEFIKFNRIEIDLSIPNEDYFDIFMFVSIVLITVDTFELGILIHDGENFIYLCLSTKTDDSCLFLKEYIQYCVLGQSNSYKRTTHLRY